VVREDLDVLDRRGVAEGRLQVLVENPSRYSSGVDAPDATGLRHRNQVAAEEAGPVDDQAAAGNRLRFSGKCEPRIVDLVAVRGDAHDDAGALGRGEDGARGKAPDAEH